MRFQVNDIVVLIPRSGCCNSTLCMYEHTVIGTTTIKNETVFLVEPVHLKDQDQWAAVRDVEIRLVHRMETKANEEAAI